jgi:predicted RNase H-like HicB family nuclease
MEYAAKIIKNGEWWEVSFPDKPNVNTCGESFEHAMEMAKEALNGMLEGELEMDIPFVMPKVKANSENNLYPIAVEIPVLI